MTSLVCWCAVDSRAVASIYVASDSRITETDGSVVSDAERKVFACRKRPDVLGYCGNANAPPRVLARLVTEMDARLADDSETAWNRAQNLVEELNRALPNDDHLYDQTKVLYASRDGEGHTNAAFAVFEISVGTAGWDFHTLAWSKARQDEKTSEEPCREMNESDIVFADGTGARDVRNWREHWAQYHASEIDRRETRGTTRARTSRGVFSALCSALGSEADPRSGGAPQLAVIHQENAAMSLGVIWNDQRFYEGTCQSESEALALDTRWHDRLFQICSPTTMQVLPDAASHSAPIRGLDPEPQPENPSNRKQRRAKAAARSAEERRRARDNHRKRFP